MRVVILNSNRVERNLMVRALQGTAKRVDAFEDEEEALAAIASDPPSVILAAVSADHGAELVRKVCSADPAREAYLVTLIDHSARAREVKDMVDAGAHDFVRRPILEVDLIERVRAPQRLVRWARRIKKGAVFNFVGLQDFRELEVWPLVGSLVAADLSQLVGHPLALHAGWDARLAEGARTATIPLSLATEQAEMRVSIAVDSATVAWLGEALLGDPEPAHAAIEDLLREFANTAGGAVKRAALQENVTFTTGLPVNEPLSHVAGSAIETWFAKSDVGGACFGIVCEGRKRDNQKVPASMLKEGMVLAHDLRTEAGVLLVTAGSRLTGTTAGRLAQMLGDRILVEVACAA